MSGASLRKLYGDWLAQVQNDNNSPINAEQLMPILQMQGIIRQNDIYTVTRKTSAVEQNKELFLAVLPTYGDFALKKLIKLLQSNGNAHVDKLIQLDSGRRASIASGEPIQIEEPVVEKEAPKVEVKVDPIEEANKTYHRPDGILSKLNVVSLTNVGDERKKYESQKNQIYANFVNKSLGCKGLALIINNENYLVPWLKNRTGSETDARNLTTVLTGLGYKVDVHRNLTADAMSFLMQYFALDQRHTELDSAVVVLLTHGLPNGSLYGIDGEIVFFEDFVGYLHERKSKNLAGKPKIFFVEACRSFASIESSRLKTAEFEANASYANLPDKSDVIVMFPRTMGYLSQKDVENGTWFIQLVCEEIAKNANKLPLAEIYTQVRERLEKERTADGPGLTCELRDCLRKTFYFYPGA